MTTQNKNYSKKINSDGEVWIVSVDEDGFELLIPSTIGNRHYDEYLQWLNDGNTISSVIESEQ